MKIYLNYPKPGQLSSILDRSSADTFTYAELKGTQKDSIEGYDNDLNRMLLGEGKEVWTKAKEALLNWQQFPPSWTRVFPDKLPLLAKNQLVVIFKLFGLWWVNPTRIVYTLDEENRFGFAYGTIEGHIEQGEELFWIEREPDGKIYYSIKAFSKPRFWGARLLYPMARSYQRKFVKESMARMKALSH